MHRVVDYLLGWIGLGLGTLKGREPNIKAKETLQIQIIFFNEIYIRWIAQVAGGGGAPC